MTPRRRTAIFRAWRAAAAGLATWLLLPLVLGALILRAAGAQRLVPEIARAHGAATPGLLLLATWGVGFLALAAIGLFLTRKGRRS